MPEWYRVNVIFFLLFATSLFSQDYHGYGGSNYGGLNSILANPASSADNCLKAEINFIGLDMSFNNSWLAIKQEALASRQAHTWRNSLANEPDNIYKNFVYGSGKDPYSAVLEQRILLPSVFYQINRNNAVALTWNIRQIGNVDGISKQFAHLFENNLYLVLHRTIMSQTLTWVPFK
jgi:hypothetical protein